MTARKVTASSASGAPRLAFSYQRVSDPKQTREGRVGLERQAGAFEGFCERHGLIANADHLVDRGLSAYHGSHRSKGALGAFMEAAKAGQIPLGSVLVVEDVDRLTREVADKQLRLLLEFFDSGLAVGVIRDNWVIDLDSYNDNPALRLVLQTRFDAANDYSRKLSGRISDVWQRRKRDWTEHRKPYLGKGARPEWLTDDGSRFVEIPGTVEMVQRMFKLCLEENMGGTQIAERLNAEGFKPAKSDAYGPPRILRILHDRRVLGEKQWPDGTISPDYFPRIVDQSLWDACQKAIDQRHDNKGRHGRGEVIANLFQGGTFCACGRALYLQTARNRQGVVTYAMLRCTGKRKHTCPQPPGDWKYDEEALLLAFMEQRWNKFFDRPADNRQRRALEKELRELEGLAATQKQQADTAAKNLGKEMAKQEWDNGLGRFYAEAARKLASNAEATQKRIQTLQTELEQISRRPSGNEVQKQIHERVRLFLASDRHDVAERRRFNNWFLSLGVRVTVLDPKLSRLQWGTTDVVIYRNGAGDIHTDETLGDMAAMNISGEEKRIERIKQEIAIAKQIKPRIKRANNPQPPSMEVLRAMAAINEHIKQRDAARALDPPSSPWPQPAKAWGHVDRKPLEEIARGRVAEIQNKQRRLTKDEKQPIDDA